LQTHPWTNPTLSGAPQTCAAVCSCFFHEHHETSFCATRSHASYLICTILEKSMKVQLVNTGAATASVVFCQSKNNQSGKRWTSAVRTQYCISASVTCAHACMIRPVFYMHVCSQPASSSCILCNCWQQLLLSLQTQALRMTIAVMLRQ